MLTIKDRDRFVNDGPFFDKYPDIYPDVTRYERLDEKGHVLESWERGDDGRMRETTQRDKIREELVAAEEALSKLEDKIDE